MPMTFDFIQELKVVLLYVTKLTVLPISVLDDVCN